MMLQGCSRSDSRAAIRQPDAPVNVAVATIKTVPIELNAIGNVEPLTAISVRSQVNGELAKVLFTEGDFVEKGQSLFQIDERPYQTQVNQTRANLAKDTAQLNQAKANLARDLSQEKFAREQADRYAELHKEGVLPKMQSDQMQSDAEVRTEGVRADQAAIESAQAAIEADQAALDRAKLELGYCTIFSPIEGRTGAVAVKQGNLVTANSLELTTINQVHPIYVTFSVPEKYVSEIRKFMAERKLRILASLRDDPSAAEQGELAFVDNSVDLTTGTIKLKGLFQNDDRKLWPGQFINVRLELSAQTDSLVIPAQAIQIGPDRQFVFVVKPDMTVEMRELTTGMQAGQEVVILKGLQAGERVVTEGQLRLMPGTRVSIQNPADAQSTGSKGRE
jgi:multidrug efflux system membrane fusion protein